MNRRVALFGSPRCGDPKGLRVFASPGDGGNGGLRRLLAAIVAGGLDEVIIDTKFNSHSATRAVAQACRRVGVAYRLR